MSSPATRLLPRVVGTELGFSLGSAGLIGLLAPHFLLLSGQVALQGATALALGAALGGVAGSLYCWLRLLRFRYLLRALAVGSTAMDSRELHQLSDEPKLAIASWLVPSGVGIVAATIVLRPPIIDLTTGITLCLLGSVITAAASLPLFVLLRAACLAAVELAPHDIMQEVLEAAEQKQRIGQRISRRMLAAVMTPVVVLAIGAALIVNAHVRRADERNREETARVFVRSALETGRSVVALAGADAAVEEGKALGFTARLSSQSKDYQVTRGDDGLVTVRAPLDSGSAEVQFSGSTVGFLSLSSIVVALLAAAVAGFLGAKLGTTLALDLRAATRNLRELGTDVVVSGDTMGTRILRSARFELIARLGRAIERLAQRFRVFAKAQERAIEARKAAARMRGLFFASVSHDLKSPLNAILGFTELVRKSENVTPGQAESLDLIERRGRELLALIETILDAARVEAGQLKLVLDPTDVTTLLNVAAQKARDLAADRDAPVLIEMSAGMPSVSIDRVRMPQALATLIAHALRTTDAAMVRLLVSLEGERLIRIEIELATQHFNPSRMEAMLDPNRDPGVSEHRGLALGLRLARAVTELHGGQVRVVRRGTTGGAFSVVLPVSRTPARSVTLSPLS